ncbi:hemolysin family protein [Halalkalicoccus subterraneus]|uniref:hemolysin family protein n=1 Tax=Halalkalicoccus subterraneus TaxID=2675002 RepID=UPI000EFD469F|nr:hemolysin family protein [Halalkalicoccus subterraneus]
MAVDAFSVGGLLLALVLVVLNGFFVASEFAFVRIRSTAVDQLVEEGRAGGDTLAEVIDSLDDYLATTQLGITIASLGLGWVGEPAVAALIEPVLESVLPAGAISVVAFGIGFGLITFLHVVFGELAPKTLAIQRAERVSLLVATPMKLFYYLFLPGIIVFNGTANAFTRALGIPSASETEETLTEEEILSVLSHSGRRGEIDMGEVRMIEHVFDLNDTSVRQVMIPRPDVVWFLADRPLSELSSAIVEAGHTRYPVLDEADEVVGFLDTKDVLRAIEADSPTEPTAGELARELRIIPESGRVDDLLSDFQRDRTQMAAVIDEWGAFEGIVTVEDVIEEIVGDLQDQFDIESEQREPAIDRLDGGAYAIDGGVAISTVNETLGTDFERTEFETVGGLVLERLNRVPEAGDTVSADGYRLTAEEVEGTRISTVVVRKEKAEERSEPSE